MFFLSGDIGRAVAVLAKAYGMRVVGLRRRPDMSSNDPLLDELVGVDQLKAVMAQSDYVVVAAALTPQTRGMIGASELAAAKQGYATVDVWRCSIGKSFNCRYWREFAGRY